MDLFQWKRSDPWIFSIEKDPRIEMSGFNSLFHSVDAMISSLSNSTLNGNNGEHMHSQVWGQAPMLPPPMHYYS